MNRRRKVSLCVAAVGMTVMSVLAPSGAAGAVDSNFRLTEVDSRCLPYLSWQGASAGRNPRANSKGTVRYCVRKYRVIESNSRKDFYVAVVEADVVFTGSWRGAPAASDVKVRSSLAAQENDYGASKTVVGRTCSRPVSVSFRFGSISVGTSPKICSGGNVTLTQQGKRGATWAADKFGSVENWDTAYLQAVKPGQVPRFTFTLERPNYRIVNGRSQPRVSTVIMSV